MLIAEQRFNLGKISRDEKLQIQIEVENAKLNLRKATRRKITALRNLGTFIGADLSDNILVAAYNEMVNITIDKSKAISYLRENRPELLRFQRRLLEAERDVSYSKLDNGPQIDLFASFGLARGSEFLSDIYSQPFTEQQVSLSINVPLVDWGKRKNEIHKAKLIQENIQDQETQFIQELENNLFLKILEFETNQQTIQDQKEILELANERYKIANERYILGNLDITNLSLAQKEKDLSQRNYIEAISSYWINYYEIRLLTGFDFLNNKLIEYK